MSERRRRAAATATVGYAGVAGAGALRHAALDARYGKETRPKVPFGHELGFLRAGAKGRKRWAAGAALGLAAVPAAAKGTNDVLRKRDDRKSFVREGLEGTRDAWADRSSNLAERPPAKLVAGNYALGAAIGSGAGGLAHLGLGRTKLGGKTRSAIAATTALAAGSSSIPVQSRIIGRATHGRYEATPNGVRRAKRTPVKPSTRAEVQRPGSPVAKADAGAGLSRNQRRARVTAAAGIPGPIGDLSSAAMAGRLAPTAHKRTALQQYAGSQAGGLTGQAAGAAGALALAHRSPAFGARADRLHTGIVGAKNQVKAKVGIKPTTGSRIPQRAKTVAGAVGRTAAGRAVARRPGVAAVGALAGGVIGGQAGQQLTYGRIMNRDDAYRRNQGQSRHGTRVGKADAVTGMSRRQEVQQIRRKQRSAALGATTAAGSIGATGLLAASYAPKLRATGRGGKLRNASFALGTLAGGVGAANSLEGAHLQRKDLAARRRVLQSKGGVAKVGIRLAPTGIRRAPAMRRGFIRQTRMPSGLTRVSTVRGGLA